MKSRTVWTLVVLFLYNGLKGVAPDLPALSPEAGPLIDLAVNSVLSALAIYFRLRPKQEYSK
jgi:hypothetical protein